MPKTYRVRLRGPAQRFYEQAPADVQDRLDGIFQSLEINPFVDNYFKFHYTGYLPIMMNAWNDGEFHVAYQLVEYPDDPDDPDVLVVDVWAVTRAP